MLSLLGTRAQISVETLLVFLVFLILLGMAYEATTKLGSASQQSINAALSRESFNELVSKIDQACTLGEGNQRMVSIKGDEATLTTPAADKKTLHFDTPLFKQDYDSSCRLTVSKTSPSRVFTVENTDGANVEIS